MNTIQDDPSPRAARPLWQAALLGLLLPAAGIILFVLVITIPHLDLAGQFTLLILAGALVLGGIFLAAVLLLHPARRQKAPAAPFPLIPLFAIIYLLPLLIVLVPAIIARLPLDLNYISGWIFLWQVVALAIIAPSLPQRRSGGKLQQVRLLLSLKRTLRDKKEWLALGGIAGLGSWLTGAFLVSLFSAQTSLAAGSPTFLGYAVLILGILLAPWAEEVFFRRHLPSRFVPRLGETGAMIAAVLLFGLLQFHPLLFLPACLLGAANTLLTQRSNTLLPAVLAHLVFNLLTIFLGWRLTI